MGTLIFAVLTVLAISLLLMREFAGVLSWRERGEAPLLLNLAVCFAVVAFAIAGVLRLAAKA